MPILCQEDMLFPWLNIQWQAEKFSHVQNGSEEGVNPCTRTNETWPYDAWDEGQPHEAKEWKQDGIARYSLAGSLLKQDCERGEHVCLAIINLSFNAH